MNNPWLPAILGPGSLEPGVREIASDLSDGLGFAFGASEKSNKSTRRWSAVQVGLVRPGHKELIIDYRLAAEARETIKDGLTILGCSFGFFSLV